MRPPRTPGPRWSLWLAATLTACGSPPEAPSVPVAPEVEEIPVTTASEEARADFQQGRRLMDVGRFFEARPFFERAVQKDPEFAYAHVNLIRTAESAREFQASLQLAVAHAAGKSDGERLLIEIHQTYFDNNAAQRIELARALVERYPHSPRAWLNLAAMQGEQNQHRAARESLHQALELDPSLLATHFAVWASNLFNEPKDFARAEQAMQASLEIDPGEARIHENLGDVYRAMHQLDRARDAYTRATEADPTLAAASIKKGHINSFLGHFEAARADYDAGLAAAEAGNRIAYANYRAFTHLHAGDPRGALDELSALLEAAEDSGLSEDRLLGLEIFTLTNQATIALHDGSRDDGSRDDGSRDDGFLADAAAILERRAAAMRANAASVDDPDFARQQEANILLWEAQLAARRGDWEAARAKAEAHRSQVAGDNNPRRFEGYHGALGLIALLRGAYVEAVAEFEKSDLNKMYVKYHLALAKEGAGRVDEAKALFREVAEWNFNSVGFALVRRDSMSRL